MVDLNTVDLDQAVRIIEGTARSCGIEVKDEAEDKKAANPVTKDESK